MTAIAGAIRLDGGPEDRALVARMQAALAHRGACSTLTAGTSRPAIAFHGRVDNRGELAALLHVDTSCPTAELVLAAYAAWGESCASRLLGDFAFVIWEPAARALLCVRDIVGVKPFFYAVADGTFLFASELHALFQHPAVQRTPNEGMVAELLNDAVTSRDETLFRDVRRLPPAHLLRVRDRVVTSSRYWTPSLQRHGGNDAAELEQILCASVACRIDRPRAAAQLSGGLDSSAIVAIAATLPDAVELNTYSLVFPGRGFDESRYIDEIVRRYNVRNTRIDVRPWDAEWFANETEHYLECPLGPTAGVLAGMYAAVRADDFTSMLTGEGADEWFSGSMQNYADLLTRGAFGEVASELVHAPRRSAALRRLLFAGVWPLVPSSIRPSIRSVTRAILRRSRVAEWLDPAFASRTAVEDRCRRPEYDQTSRMSRATWDIAQYLTDGGQALAFEVADRLAARSRVEERHPFYDRRVIEFALALPEARRGARGVRKRVLRDAMHGRLPDLVRERTDKADFSRLYLDWFEALGGDAAYEQLAIAECGWVKPDVLKREYRRAVAALKSGRDAPALPALWNVLAIEAWFRAAVGRQPRVARHAMTAS